MKFLRCHKAAFNSFEMIWLISTKSSWMILLSLYLTFGGYAQERVWYPLSEQPDWTVSEMCVFQGSLIIAGSFNHIGALPMNNIAKYDGTNFTSITSSVQFQGGMGYILDLASTDDSLFVVGNFDEFDGQVADDLTIWDGVSWTMIPCNATGFIQCVEIYNDELYVAGTFDSIGGVLVNGIAKWDGMAWQQLGEGLRNGNYSGSVDDLVIFDNKLFALGIFDSAGTVSCSNIAGWDGLQWIGTTNTFTVAARAAGIHNDTLYFTDYPLDAGTHFVTPLVFYDGNSIGSTLCQTAHFYYRFISFNGKLFGGGGDGDHNEGNCVSSWNGSSWEPEGTGIDDYVICM